MQPRLKGVAGIQMLWDAYICQCGGAERPMCRKQPRRVKRRTEDVWGWKRCTQQSSFSLTALSHGHTLLSQSTHSYNSCFVSWVMFCSAVVSLWGVFLFCRFSLLCVGLCYSFYSRLEIHFGKTIQTKCFKSKIGFRRLFSLKTVNAAILPAAGFLSCRQTLSAASPSRSETKAPVPVSS